MRGEVPERTIVVEGDGEGGKVLFWTDRNFRGESSAKETSDVGHKRVLRDTVARGGISSWLVSFEFHAQTEARTDAIFDRVYRP